jgi:ADP-ribosylglycohydrolase
MPDLLDKFQGCLLGAAIGDAFCAGCEGGLLERLLWRLIGRTRQGLRRWTDDTQMSIDLARHLLRHGRIKQDALAADFAVSCRWSRGYGPSTAAVLRQVRAGADWRRAVTARHLSGSYGNGAAMRIAPLALFHHDQPKKLEEAVKQASAVTHAHPAALAGARLVAFAIVHALQDACSAEAAQAMSQQCHASDFAAAMRTVSELLAAPALPEPARLRQLLGTESTALRSCPAAALLGLRFRQQPLTELLAYIRRCGGDTDTVAAMAGAIWGAAEGRSRIPEQMLRAVEAHELLLRLAGELYNVLDSKEARCC